MKINKQYTTARKIEDVEFGECFLYTNHIHMKVDASLYENVLADNDYYLNIVVDLEECRLNGLADGLEVIPIQAEMTAYIDRKC